MDAASNYDLQKQVIRVRGLVLYEAMSGRQLELEHSRDVGHHDGVPTIEKRRHLNARPDVNRSTSSLNEDYMFDRIHGTTAGNKVSVHLPAANSRAALLLTSSEEALMRMGVGIKFAAEQRQVTLEITSRYSTWNSRFMDGLWKDGRHHGGARVVR